MGNIFGFLLINIYAFLVIFTTTIIFFSKKRLGQFEDVIYKNFLLTNIFMSLSGLLLGIVVTPEFQFNNIVIIILNKIYLICLMIWIGLLTFYYLHIVVKKKDKLQKIFYSIMMLCILLIIFLPINVTLGENGAVSEGVAIVFTYTVFGIGFLIQIVCVLKDYRHLKNRRNVPLYLLIFLGTIVLVIMIINPNCNYLVNPIFIFVAFTMYFTIENPDMKMLKEIQQSKEFVEQANNEKAMFLYNTSQELKSPVNAIGQRCEELLQEQDINEIMNGIKDIKFAAKRLATTISGTLDMNRTQASNIEIKVSKYSTKMLFQEMISISKLNMKDKMLDFRVKLDENIPEYLMGDSIRLKQIISTIMNNAIKHTEKGFIEFNISSVIKHDVCRLIITIEDSGAGIESKRLETLFYNTEDEDGVDEDRLNNVQDTRESLSVVKILTNLIGGTVIVNSELGKGSKFTVVLDQQIAEMKKSSTEIAVESLSSNKRILVVDDEEENLKQIAKLLSKYEVNVETVEWGQECLEKVRKKQKYDLILLDEDMPRLNGIKTFEKLKLEENFNVPVVIMITNNHIEYKDRYLYNGFSGCVVKPLKKQDVEKLIKKYIKTDE